MGIEPFLVASSVNLIVAQRLVRKICTSCKVSEIKDIKDFGFELSDEMVKKHLEKEKKGVRVYRGQGCDLCRQTGYSGRVGVFEILTVSEKIKEAIVAKQDSDAIRDIAIEEGMQTMMDDGLEKVKVAMTTIEELLRVVKE
jgi:type II secretory ATPase GspE/PulE/Tfp pilus assembly ATPase PilB-like protein